MDGTGPRIPGMEGEFYWSKELAFEHLLKSAVPEEMMNEEYASRAFGLKEERKQLKGDVDYSFFL